MAGNEYTFLSFKKSFHLGLHVFELRDRSRLYFVHSTPQHVRIKSLDFSPLGCTIPEAGAMGDRPSNRFEIAP